MFNINYNTKHIECPYCGESETWDIFVRDTVWQKAVNEFISEHRQCEGEYLLGIENTKAERNSQ